MNRTPSPESNPQAPFPPLCALAMPPVLPAVVGRECSLYFDGVLRSWLPWWRHYNLEVLQAGNLGRQDSDRWRCTPTAADVGDHPLQLVVRHNGAVLAGGATTVRVIPATAGRGVTRRVLVIGDSTTAAGLPTQTLLESCAANQTRSTYAVTLIGTQGRGNNRHEGWSGATLAFFASDPRSPFVNPESGRFDFRYYLSSNGFRMSAGDSVFLLLGINDVFPVRDDTALAATLSAMVDDVTAIIANVQVAVPGVRFHVGLTIAPSRTQEAFGASYGVGQSRDRYAWNVAQWRERVIAEWGDAAGANVFLAPLSVCLDTVNDMPAMSEAINARNPRPTTRQSNGVHPAPSGYRQIGDMLWACLLAQET